MYDSNKKSRSAGPMTLHDAICAECGNECKVPFKPNGKKPVFCGDCFRKSEGGGDRPHSRPFQPRGSSDGLAELNRKVDRILRILEDAE